MLNSERRLDIIKELRYRLKAILFERLRDIGSGKYLCKGNIIAELNSLMKRKEKDDAGFDTIANYLEWARAKSSFDATQIINIPDFKPKDLIPLFVQLNDEGKYDKGPLLEKANVRFFDEKSQTFLGDLSSFYSKDFATFSSFLDEIVRTYFKRFDRKEGTPEKDDAESYSDYVDRLLRSGQCASEPFFKEMSKLYTITNNLDEKKEELPLLLDDFDIIKTNDWKSKDKASKYANLLSTAPSTFLYLLRYPECSEKLHKCFSEIEVRDNSFSLYLLLFRIFSSERCITFEGATDTWMSKFISTHLKELCMKKLDEGSINMEWVNLFVDSLPQEYKEAHLHEIRNYLKNLSRADEPKDDVKSIIEPVIEKLLNIIVDRTFSNTLGELFSSTADTDIKKQEVPYFTNIESVIKEEVEKHLSWSQKDYKEKRSELLDRANTEF